LIAISAGNRARKSKFPKTAARGDLPGRRQCIEWIAAELSEPSRAEVALNL
jgi:hypothetical protein